MVRAKRRNYLAIQSHYRSHQERDRDMDEKEQVRVKAHDTSCNRDAIFPDFSGFPDFHKSKLLMKNL